MKWIVEYSQSQGCFHVDDISTTQMRNFRAIMRHRPSDWLFMGVFDSHEKASEFAGIARMILEEQGTLTVDENGQLSK